MSSQEALVRGLAESDAPNSASNTSKVDTQAKNLPQSDPKPTKFERLAKALLNIIDVLLVEKKVHQGLSAVDDGDRLVERGINLNGYKGKISRNVALNLKTTLSERRYRLAEQLADAIQQPSFRGKELR